MSDRLRAGLMSSKAFTELLLPPNDFQRTITKWENDLECTIEDFLWKTILRKSNFIFDPYLRDFHIQFLHRGFHYNVAISKYRPSQSPVCDFCKQDNETYLHLFWECTFVQPLWVAVADFCHDAVDSEEFSMFKCLLSNFQSPLLCLISSLIKRYIHNCKHANRLPTIVGFFEKLQFLRDVHFKKCRA